jgi:hypothetical protein
LAAESHFRSLPFGDQLASSCVFFPLPYAQMS